MTRKHIPVVHRLLAPGEKPVFQTSEGCHAWVSFRGWVQTKGEVTVKLTGPVRDPNYAHVLHWIRRRFWNLKKTEGHLVLVIRELGGCHYFGLLYRPEEFSSELVAVNNWPTEI